MNPIIYVALVFSTGAIATLVHAVLSAPEGYEDEHGFHVLRRRAVPQPASATPNPMNSARDAAQDRLFI